MTFPSHRNLVPRHNPSFSSAGFSLVEVTIAIGIIAFAYVTLLGLLQSGLVSFREAMDRTISAQIAQAILNDKRQTPFADLINPAKNPAELRFNDEGQPVRDSSQTVFVATVKIESPVSVPGPGPSRFNNRSLAKVIVEVSRRPGGTPPTGATGATGAGSQTRQFITYIPRT